MWNEREFYIIMIDMKWIWIFLALTSAPCSIKNLTISIESFLIAIESGDSILQNIFHIIMINMKWKRILYNNDWCEMKKKVI